jgi:hypothetical protein
MAEFTDADLRCLAQVDTKIDGLAADVAEIKTLLMQRDTECKECKRETNKRFVRLEQFQWKVAGALSIIAVAVPAFFTKIWEWGAS